MWWAFDCFGLCGQAAASLSDLDIGLWQGKKKKKVGMLTSRFIYRVWGVFEKEEDFMETPGRTLVGSTFRSSEVTGRVLFWLLPILQADYVDASWAVLDVIWATRRGVALTPVYVWSRQDCSLMAVADREGLFIAASWLVNKLSRF